MERNLNLWTALNNAGEIACANSSCNNSLVRKSISLLIYASTNVFQSFRGGPLDQESYTYKHLHK